MMTGANRGLVRLPQEIERRYAAEFLTKFPYQDCYKLQKTEPRLTHNLIPDLDLYFSFIAGYSSSATRLKQRPRDKLLRAVDKLKQSFFDQHPRYKPIEGLVSASFTQTLHHRLRLADELRRDLITILEPLVNVGAPE